MRVLKNKIVILTIFLMMITVASIFIYENRPRTTRYKRVKLVFENTFIHLNTKDVKL